MIKIFLLNSLLCRKRMYGIPGFSKMEWLPYCEKQQRLSFKICSVIALLVMVLGHHNSQTSCHLISFWRDFLKKESSAVTQEACRTLFIKLNIKQPTRQEVTGTLWKGWMLVIKNLGDVFSTFCHYTFEHVCHIVYHILGLFEEIWIK